MCDIGQFILFTNRAYKNNHPLKWTKQVRHLVNHSCELDHRPAKNQGKKIYIFLEDAFGFFKTTVLVVATKTSTITLCWMFLVQNWAMVLCSYTWDRYLEQLQTQKNWNWEMRDGLGYESRKCTYAGLLRSHKSTPVKHKHILFLSACSSPLITEALPGSWPGQYMRTDSP